MSAWVSPPKPTMSNDASDAQHDDASREREPVAAVGELAREEAVLGEDRGEAREGRERRVRREHEDERRERQEQEEAGRGVPEHRPATSAMTVAGPRLGTIAVATRDERDADEEDGQQDRHDGERRRRVAWPRAA